MRHARIPRLVIGGTLLFALSAITWYFICRTAGVSEPWDADIYWTAAYPASLFFSAAFGAGFGRWGGLAGLFVIFSQLPVMWIITGGGGAWPIAFIFLAVLAAPAIAISAIAGRYAAGHRDG